LSHLSTSTIKAYFYQNLSFDFWLKFNIKFIIDRLQIGFKNAYKIKNLIEKNKRNLAKKLAKFEY